MTDDDLGPIPEPTTEEPQLVPGGPDADALHSDPADTGLARDLDPADNAAVDDAAPDEISEPDDKQQAPDGSEDSDESDDSRGADEAAATEDDPAAGQEAEDGSVEPPA